MRSVFDACRTYRGIVNNLIVTSHIHSINNTSIVSHKEQIDNNNDNSLTSSHMVMSLYSNILSPLYGQTITDLQINESSVIPIKLLNCETRCNESQDAM